MSGPKSSRYTLTAEQLKRILEEQERIRKELEEKAKKERECKEAREYLDAVSSKVGLYAEMVQKQELKARSEGAVIPDELTGQYELFKMKVEQLRSVCSIKTDATHTSLMNARNQAEQGFKEIVSTEDRLVTEISDVLIKHRIQDDSKIVEGMQISFASVGAVEEREDPATAEATGQLVGLLSMELSHKLQGEVTSAIEHLKSLDDPSVIQNFISITVEPLKKRCRSFAAFAKSSKDKYDTMIDKYHALCDRLTEQAEQFAFSESGILELENAISTLERRIQQEAEQVYISRSVDEVMKEMGYEVIGHRQVRKKSGKTFKSKLLTYEDGTVVNVTESSGGQITMEIGAMDSQDRLPDANERVALQKTMESFCNDFKEIERRLTERGVVLDSRLSMAPPEEAYAQIINFSDYELVGDYQTVIAKRQKQSQAERQKMVRND